MKTVDSVLTREECAAICVKETACAFWSHLAHQADCRIWSSDVVRFSFSQPFSASLCITQFDGNEEWWGEFSGLRASIQKTGCLARGAAANSSRLDALYTLHCKQPWEYRLTIYRSGVTDCNNCTEIISLQQLHYRVRLWSVTQTPWKTHVKVHPRQLMCYCYNFWGEAILKVLTGVYVPFRQLWWCLELWRDVVSVFSYSVLLLPSLGGTTGSSRKNAKSNPVFRGTNFKTKLLQKLRLVKTVLLLSFFLDDPVLITCEWSKLLLPSCPPQESFWQFHTNIPVQPELGKYCKHHRVGIYCSPPSVLQQVFWTSILSRSGRP